MTQYAVTGATGFLGRNLVQRLLEQQDAVRALVPEESEVEPLRRRGVDVRPGDLNGTRDLANFVEGASVVIHCAGVVDLSSTSAEHWKVNVEGSERLFAACVQAGVPRFVFLSSVGVYGHGNSPIREDAPKRPVGAYGKSKWAAEKSLWTYHADHGLPAVALRPCIVYGPHDQRIWPLVESLCRKRFVPLPDGGKRIVDLVHVADVVDAVLAASRAEAAVGKAYNITDGETHSFRDLVDTFARITDTRPVILPVPGGLLVRAVQAGLRWKQLRGIEGDWVGQADRVRALAMDLHYAIDAARRDLAFSPRVGIAEGMRRMLCQTVDADAPAP